MGSYSCTHVHTLRLEGVFVCASEMTCVVCERVKSVAYLGSGAGVVVCPWFWSKFDPGVTAGEKLLQVLCF